MATKNNDTNKSDKAEKARDIIEQIHALYDKNMANRLALDRATDAMYDFIRHCEGRPVPG